MPALVSRDRTYGRSPMAGQYTLLKDSFSRLSTELDWLKGARNGADGGLTQAEQAPAAWYPPRVDYIVTRKRLSLRRSILEGQGDSHVVWKVAFRWGIRREGRGAQGFFVKFRKEMPGLDEPPFEGHPSASGSMRTCQRSLEDVDRAHEDAYERVSAQPGPRRRRRSSSSNRWTTTSSARARRCP